MIEGPSRNFVSIRKLLVDSVFLRVFLAAKKKNEICWEKKVHKFFYSKDEKVDWELDRKSRKIVRRSPGLSSPLHE